MSLQTSQSQRALLWDLTICFLRLGEQPGETPERGSEAREHEAAKVGVTAEALRMQGGPPPPVIPPLQAGPLCFLPFLFTFCFVSRQFLCVALAFLKLTVQTRLTLSAGIKGVSH